MFVDWEVNANPRDDLITYLLNAELDLDFTAAIEAEAQGQALCMQTRNFREFHASFVAKRTPEFD